MYGKCLSITGMVVWWGISVCMSLLVPSGMREARSEVRVVWAAGCS